MTPQPPPALPRPHTKTVGDRTELIVLGALARVYSTVLLPFGENQRYDLVVHTDEGFITVQCKTGRLRKGSVVFPAASSMYHRGGGSRSYRGEVDYFGVYCPDTDAVYLVPVEVVGATSGSLRVDPPLNRQDKNIRWASDYRLALPDHSEQVLTTDPRRARSRSGVKGVTPLFDEQDDA